MRKMDFKEKSWIRSDMAANVVTRRLQPKNCILKPVDFKNVAGVAQG